ncbi:TrmH family RNA methyltransferase [Parvibium lacunae]|uniref:RNA methyltransferase n=1 Tax=Parvibium lacunae TaxID=1888893 RepID=A0A368L8M1_9BURK|nr:RNA methyltransferase [Parvibium lacunae]RCS59579.1 RNA methyltransferase [Parvibium lacunae]
MEKSRASAQQGITLLEGIHLCKTYLEAGKQPRQVIVGELAQAQAEIMALLQGLAGIPVSLLSQSLCQQLTQVENGIPVWFEVPIAQATLPDQIKSDCLVLDGLQDPGNVGTILRSAAAAGVKQVFALEATASLWSQKVLRAGMGAHCYLTLWETDWKTLAPRLQIPIIATSSHATQSLYELNLCRPHAWVFGHEGQGVRADILSLAQPVCIPQPGGLESLNVGAAASICLFETVRQRMLTPGASGCSSN